MPGARGGQKKTLDLPGVGGKGCCEPPCGFWELKQGPLQDQQVFLTVESLLQPQDTLS